MLLARSFLDCSVRSRQRARTTTKPMRASKRGSGRASSSQTPKICARRQRFSWSWANLNWRVHAQRSVERLQKDSEVNTQANSNFPDGAQVPPPATPVIQHRRRSFIPIAIGMGSILIIALGATMVVHAESRVNKVALDQSAKPVTVVEARSTTFRASRTYVGTLEPWVEAKVGPQMVSAYVDTVLVRPGAIVKKG